MRDFDSIKNRKMRDIENHLRHIYNKGYDDGLKAGVDGGAYERGLNDAWAVATKIACMSCLDCDDLFTTHNLSYVFTHISILEAKDAVKAWEEKQAKQAKQDWWKRIGVDIYECPACGMNMRTSDICAHKYCHRCGKKMQESEE